MKFPLCASPVGLRWNNTIVIWDCWLAGDPESKEEVEADTSGDETDPVDPGHKARDEMFCAVASIRVGYWTPEFSTHDMWLAFGWCIDQKLAQHVTWTQVLRWDLHVPRLVVSGRQHIHLNTCLVQGSAITVLFLHPQKLISCLYEACSGSWHANNKVQVGLQTFMS